MLASGRVSTSWHWQPKKTMCVLRRICMSRSTNQEAFPLLEMGMAEKSVTKSLAMASHTTPEQIAALYATLGDLGLVAGQVKSEEGSVPSVMSVEDVFLDLKA